MNPYPHHYYVEVETRENHTWDRCTPNLFNIAECEKWISVLRQIYQHGENMRIVGALIVAHFPTLD